MKGLHICNTVTAHPFVEDPEDAWKPDNERECAYCTRFLRDWEHKINGRYRRVAEELDDQRPLGGTWRHQND